MNIALIGSRRLTIDHEPQVRRVVRAVLRAGHTILTGDAIGADAQVIRCAMYAGAEHLHIYTVGRPGPLTASSTVLLAKMSAATIHNTTSAPTSYSTRLHQRTQALADAADAVIAWQPGAGSCIALRTLARRELPILVFAAANHLPRLGPGTWQPTTGRGCWAGSWRWQKTP